MSVLALYAALAFGLCAVGAWVCEQLEAADRKRKERSERLRKRLAAWQAVRRLDQP